MILKVDDAKESIDTETSHRNQKDYKNDLGQEKYLGIH